MSTEKITVELPKWCIDAVKAMAVHMGDKDNIIPVEKLFGRILYRHMFSVVDAALDMGVPLDEIGDGVLEVILEDVQEMLYKLGIEDQDVAYSVLLSLINISSKHVKGVDIKDIEI